MNLWFRMVSDAPNVQVRQQGWRAANGVIAAEAAVVFTDVEDTVLVEGDATELAAGLRRVAADLDLVAGRAAATRRQA